MTGNEISHIKVTYDESSDGHLQVTATYAASPETMREMNLWASQATRTSKDLQAWLENQGCRLDSSEGPAFVWRSADGSAGEQYYRDGKLHREDGPAWIKHRADGSTCEMYFRDGKFVKRVGIASLSAIQGVTIQRPAPKAPDAQGPSPA